MLESESANYSSESQKLQQKLQIMTEMYQENELKLHRFGLELIKHKFHLPLSVFAFYSVFFIGNSNANSNNSVVS